MTSHPRELRKLASLFIPRRTSVLFYLLYLFTLSFRLSLMSSAFFICLLSLLFFHYAPLAFFFPPLLPCSLCPFTLSSLLPSVFNVFCLSHLSPIAFIVHYPPLAISFPPLFPCSLCPFYPFFLSPFFTSHLSFFSFFLCFIYFPLFFISFLFCFSVFQLRYTPLSLPSFDFPLFISPFCVPFFHLLCLLFPHYTSCCFFPPCWPFFFIHLWLTYSFLYI